MANENLILMINALRLELQNLALQNTTANAIIRGDLPDQLLEAAVIESKALRLRADQAANTALGNIAR